MKSNWPSGKQELENRKLITLLSTELINFKTGIDLLAKVSLFKNLFIIEV